MSNKTNPMWTALVVVAFPELQCSSFSVYNIYPSILLILLQCSKCSTLYKLSENFNTSRCEWCMGKKSYVNCCGNRGISRPSVPHVQNCYCYEFVVWVVGSSQSKQNAGLSEQQQGYLFQTDVVNFAQLTPQQAHARLANYTLTFVTRHTQINTASAKCWRDLYHTSIDRFHCHTINK